MASTDREGARPKADDWQVVEGTGWISMPGFGQIAPRRDNVGGGRNYFTAMTNADEYARVTGQTITEGPETWHYEPDEPFFLADYADQCVEVTISVLQGGRYAVKYRPSVWPTGQTGAW